MIGRGSFPKKARWFDVVFTVLSAAFVLLFIFAVAAYLFEAASGSPTYRKLVDCDGYVLIDDIGVPRCIKPGNGNDIIIHRNRR